MILAERLINERDYKHLGQVLLESHQSLSVLYEVSTKEIDFLIKASRKIGNHLGGRIMGGGFGGSTINIFNGEVDKDDFNRLKTEYKIETGLDLNMIEVLSSEGTHLS